MIKKLLHLCHDLTGSNGINTYLKNFVNLIDCDHYIAIKEGKYNNIKNDFKNVLELESLTQVRPIVEKYNIDTIIIHYAGAGSWKDEDNYFILNGEVHKKFPKPTTPDSNGFALINVFNQWFKDLENKPEIIIIAHSEFKLPDHIFKPRIDYIVNVSHKVYTCQLHVKTNQRIIYPVLSENIFNDKERSEDQITIGWLGSLQKYDGLCYRELKRTFAEKDNINFLFVGNGILENSPPTNFEFINYLETSDFMDRIDIFLYPSLLDSFSYALLEAITAKKICLVSNEVKEIAEAGGLNIFYNPKNMINKLEKMIIEFDYYKEKALLSSEEIKTFFNPEIFINQWNKILNFK